MKPTTFVHDLSADETKVSFELLIKTAEIAAGYARVNCERALQEIQDASFRKDYYKLQSVARRMVQYSLDLETATCTLHVLTESQTREKFTLIGKPPVKQFKINVAI